MIPGPVQEIILDVWRRGQRLSAVGPGPVEDQLERSVALARQLPCPDVGVDLGSGAGIPGLVLAAVWPGSRWLLLDAAARRARLLQEAVSRLDWTARVDVIHGRAEDLARDVGWRGVADLVVARSFGPPATTAECGAGFLRPDGVLVVTEPPADGDSPRWPAEPLSRLGLRPVGSPPTDEVRVQRLVRIGPIPDAVPRRAGVPTKRPLF